MARGKTPRKVRGLRFRSNSCQIFIYKNGYKTVKAQIFYSSGELVENQFYNEKGQILNEENLVKISLENYQKYPTHLKNLKNIALGRSEPNKGIIYLTPIDNVAQFYIYVDFGKGNAILKYENNGYKYKPYEGLRLMARIKENININN